MFVYLSINVGLRWDLISEYVYRKQASICACMDRSRRVGKLSSNMQHFRFLKGPTELKTSLRNSTCRNESGKPAVFVFLWKPLHLLVSFLMTVKLSAFTWTLKGVFQSVRSSVVCHCFLNKAQYQANNQSSDFKIISLTQIYPLSKCCQSINTLYDIALCMSRQRCCSRCWNYTMSLCYR